MVLASSYFCQVLHSLCGHGPCRAPQLRLQAREEPLTADERWLGHKNQHKPEVYIYMYQYNYKQNKCVLVTMLVKYVCMYVNNNMFDSLDTPQVG